MHPLLLTFAALFIPAKLMGTRLPFYSAALLAVAGLYAVESALNGYDFGPVVTRANGIKLAAAVVLFYLLDRHEDKRLRWLATFAVAFVIFGFFL